MYKKVLLMIALLSIGVGLEAKVIVVDVNGTGDYLTIQDGVTAADSGDTVFVKNGEYYTGDQIIELDIPIWLLGESMNSTIISVGGMLGYGIIVNAEGCTISGFKLIGGSIKPSPPGIVCSGTSPTITYNTFIETPNTGMGAIGCEGSSSPVIHYNNFNCLSGVYLLAGAVMNINAENNYWGTTDTAQINWKIFDGNDYPGLGFVDYIPYLQEPVSIGENDQQSQGPGFFRFDQNRPNPFNANTKITYQVHDKEPVRVTLKIYNVAGEEIKMVVNEIQKQGDYTVEWDGSDKSGGKVPRGVYYLRLVINGHSTYRKAVLVK